MNRLLLGIIVVVGVPAATVLYVAAMEWFLGRLPSKRATALRPWLWIGPAVLLLLFYLVYPTINTMYLSLLDAKSDPENPRWFMVDVEFTEAFGGVVSLDEIRETPALQEMDLLKKRRLSVQRVTREEFQAVRRMGRKKG